jgi:hypothetical protein
VGGARTSDPRLEKHVARAERPGYSDRGSVIRIPDVIVYELQRD